MSISEIASTVQTSILVVGCGKMGSAIVQGWVKSGVDGHCIHIVDPNAKMLSELKANYAVNLYQTPDELPCVIFDYIMVALKPQQIDASLPVYSAWTDETTSIISIAAGINSDSLNRLLPKLSRVIRVMPNTPALIQKGVLVAYATSNMPEANKNYCQQLFTSLGHFYWLENEDQMDAVTAISGSGPAYLFYFVECFVKAAENTRLPAELAKNLAINTILGAAYLLESEDKDPSQLRVDVTSPKGTTEAALNVLMQNNSLEHLMCDVVQAATNRSQELAKLV